MLRARARERKEQSANVETISDFSDDASTLDHQTTIDSNTEGEGVDCNSEGISIETWVYTATHLQRFLDEISRNRRGSSDGRQSLKKIGRVQPAIVRRRCKEILLAEGFDPSGQKKPLSIKDFVEWDPVLRVKLGAALLRLLLDHTSFASDSNGQARESAFSYARKKTGDMKFNGFISIHPELLYLALTSGSSFLPPRANANTRCQPMVVPPKKWTDLTDGGYEVLKVDFMRTRHCKTQKVSLWGRAFKNALVLGI